MAGRLTALPTTDAKLLTWVTNFKTLITATPTIYGLTAGQATAFGTLVTNFATALQANEPGVRNKSTTSTKNDCRDLLKKSARELSSIITGQPNVTDAQRYALGLNVRAMPTPIPPPTSQPAIEIIRVFGKTVSLRFKSTETIGKRARPFGTIGLQVYSYIGAVAPTDPAAYRFEGTTSNTLMDVQFPSDTPAGSQVYFTACWVSPRPQTGPAANPISTHLQYGNTVVSLPKPEKKRRAA